jgi:hypothetical protein
LLRLVRTVVCDHMVLDAATLERSIVHAGSSASWAPVLDRLNAREPLILGVFGASVAQVRRVCLCSRLLMCLCLCLCP